MKEGIMMNDLELRIKKYLESGQIDYEAMLMTKSDYEKILKCFEKKRKYKRFKLKYIMLKKQNILSCDGCKYRNKTDKELPCIKCQRAHKDLWRCM